jgi:uncharacterized protein YbjT (DUF2867 family)
MIKSALRALALAALFIAAPAAAEIQGPVLVFGGTSGTGLATVQNLRAMDVPVTVFVRPTSNTGALDALGVDLVVGDALNADDVLRAFDADDFKTVVSSLGGRRGEPRPDLDGNKNITAAAKAKGVKRIVQVSSIGVGSTREPPGPDAPFMAEVFYIKTLAEDDLIASGLDYTIVRPGGLRRGEATGTGVIADEEHMGSIDRQELGRLIVSEVLADDSTIGKVVYAYDPTLPAPEEE